MTEAEQNTPSKAEYTPSVTTPERAERSRGEQFSIDLDKINSVIEAMLSDRLTDPAALKQAWAIRADVAATFIDSLEPTADNPKQRERVQFDVMVNKAQIYERLGDTLRYLRDLDTAEGFALAKQLSDVIDSLKEEIDSKVDELDNSPDALVIKLREHISFEKRELLRRLIYEGIEMDALLGRIRDIITNENGDPDKVLKSIGVVA